MENIKYNNKGFTLVELLITLAIMVIVLQLLYSIFFVGSKSFNISKDRGFTQQDARLVGEFINSELRYINQLDYEQLKGEHNSLEIKLDGDTSYTLIKRKHQDESDKEGEVITTINGEGYISIKNNKEGKIRINFEHQGYRLNLDSILENSANLNTGVELLSDSDNEVIYYSFVNNTPIEDEDEYDSDGKTEDWIKGKRYYNREEVLFNGVKYRATNSGNNDNDTNPEKNSKKWKRIY